MGQSVERYALWSYRNQRCANSTNPGVFEQKTFYHKKWWSPIDIIFIKQSWRLVRGKMRPINQWHARIVTSRLARDHAWLCSNRRDIARPCSDQSTILKRLDYKRVLLCTWLFEKKNTVKQVCIPVGYVPPAHWPYLVVSGGGVRAMPPCHACPPAIHAPLPCMPPCHVCPPVNRMTDRCKHITLPQLHCGR